MLDYKYMSLALENAKKAYELDEVPVGALIVYKDSIIASTYNRKEIDNVSTYHAEILAIDEACRKLGTWRLDECVLYTTIEPCMMCTGAIIQSRLSRVVYGASNSSFGYLSHVDISKLEIKSGVLRDECSKLMSNFFVSKR